MKNGIGTKYNITKRLAICTLQCWNVREICDTGTNHTCRLWWTRWSVFGDHRPWMIDPLL